MIHYSYHDGLYTLLKLIKFFTMIFAVFFEEKSMKGSYRFRVISAFKSRENRSLAGIGRRCRHLAETTFDRPTPGFYWWSVDISRPAATLLELFALFVQTGSSNSHSVAPRSGSISTI
jgi:hypothetical protein